MRLLLILLLLAPVPAAAFERVVSRDAFVALVSGKQLSGAWGVRLNVGADGAITGRGFGQRVTGGWRWADGMFCRTLNTALRNFPENCQVVAVQGATVRFIADRGNGDVADLELRAR